MFNRLFTRAAKIADPRPLIQITLLVVALWVGFAVLLNAAETRHMRPDENHTFEATDASILQAVTVVARDVHAPAYFVVFDLWRSVTGVNEFTARFSGVLFSMLTLALTFVIGRRWSGRWWGGVAALVALSISAMFYKYSVEIRPYPLLILVGTLTMLTFARWVERPAFRRALWYGVTVTLLMYTHYLGAFLILVQGVYLLLRLAAVRGPAALALLKQGAFAYLGAFLLWLPWLPVFVDQVLDESKLVGETDTLIGGFGKAGSALPTDWSHILGLIRLMTNSTPLLFGLLVIVGIILLWRRRLFWLAAVWALVIPTLILGLNLVVPIYDPRYIAYIAPGLAIVVGMTLAALPVRVKLLPILLLVIFGLWTVDSGVNRKVGQRDYLRAMETAFQPGDVLLTGGYAGMELKNMQWYAPTILADGLYHVTLPVPGIEPDWASGYEDLPRCVWFGTSSWYSDDTQAIFAELTADRLIMAVIGDDRDAVYQRLCTTPEETPVPLGDAITFLGADSITVTAIPREVQLNLWWVADEAPAADYSIGVYLLAAGGALAAQQDGPITNFWTGEHVNTSALQPGQPIVDRRIIALPADLSAGDYTLALSVYQSWDGVRLPVAGAADDLLRFGTVTVE